MQAGIPSCYLSITKREKLGKWSKNMQPWYPLTLARDQPRPAFSRASRLRYHNSPLLTFFSCLCILIFSSLHLPLLALVLTHFSLSQLLPDLNHIIVRAPGAGQTHIPPLCSDRQRERKERDKWEKERIVCQCHPFLLLLGEGKFIFHLGWNINAAPAVMRKLYLRQMGPERNNTGENLRGVFLCSRILTPNHEFKPNWVFP